MQARKFTMVAPNKLDLSLPHLRQYSNSSIKNMVSSLEKRGQLNPIVAAGDDKHAILVDGFKRQQAAVIIGMEKLSVQILPLSSVNMKAYIYLLNRNESFSFIGECILIQELIEKDGLTQTEISVILERHKSWVCRRLNTYRCLNTKIIEDIRVGLLPSGSGQSLAVLQHLHNQYKNYPHWSYQLHADNLAVCVEQKPELGKAPSYSTVQRRMKERGWTKKYSPVNKTKGQILALNRLEKLEVRSFEAEYVNALWHLDFHRIGL